MDTMDYVAIIALGLGVLLLFRVISLQSQINELRFDLQQSGSRPTNISGAPVSSGMYASTLDQIDADQTAELEARLRELVAGGKRIQAIKELREARNLSLRDAKEMVDQLERY